MVRWIILTVLVVVITAVSTFALNYYGELTGTGTSGSLPLGLEPAQDGPMPVAEVTDGGEPIFEFDVMAMGSSNSHVWTLTNTGEGDLQLRKGESTCSCTIADLGEEETAMVAPGESIPIKLDWTPKDIGPFSQAAEILTNDPENPKVRFSVRGNVVPAITLLPGTGIVEVPSMSSEEPLETTLGLYSTDQPDMQILDARVSQPDFFNVEIGPMTEQMLEQAGITSGGYQIQLTIAAGMPLGNFRELIVVETDHPVKPIVEFRVVGRVHGPIQVLYTGGDRERETLRIRGIDGDEGGSKTLTLQAKTVDPVRFEVLEAPEPLQIRIERSDWKPRNPELAMSRYTMIVEVPAGLDSQVLKGTIVLRTDLPNVSQIKIPVDVLILDR